MKFFFVDTFKPEIMNLLHTFAEIIRFKLGNVVDDSCRWGSLISNTILTHKLEQPIRYSSLKIENQA